MPSAKRSITGPYEQSPVRDSVWPMPSRSALIYGATFEDPQADASIPRHQGARRQTTGDKRQERLLIILNRKRMEFDLVSLSQDWPSRA
jgi:hypothetical protein